MKKEKGITLISLVITIIVLLILAGVTIVTLTGDNGLLQKATIAKETNEEAEIKEQIRLIYQEYQLGQYTAMPTNVETKLKELYGDINVSDVSVSNGRILATIKDKLYCYNPEIGEVYIDKFNYGSKKRTTVEPNDDISIGTEKFKVLTNTNGTIVAIPYYDLVTVTATGEVKQGPEVDGTSTAISSTFATSHYWTVGDDAIDMSNSLNNIQQYITAYKTTLEKLGVDGATVRAARRSELIASGVTDTMRNPGRNGGFWIGSDYSGNYICVWWVTMYGGFRNEWCLCQLSATVYVQLLLFRN